MNSFWPVFRLNLVQQARSLRWVYAFVAFLILEVLGWWRSHSWFSAFNDGVMLGAMIALNFGIAYDRRTGFDLFSYNFASPMRIFLAKISATLCFLAAFMIATFVAGVCLSFQPNVSAWSAANALLFLWLTLPLVLLCEIFLNFFAPAAIGILGFGLGLAILISRPGGPERVAAFLGLHPVVGDFRTLDHLALVNLVWTLAAVPIVWAIWSFRHSPRRIASRE